MQRVYEFDAQTIQGRNHRLSVEDKNYLVENVGLTPMFQDTVDIDLNGVGPVGLPWAEFKRLVQFLNDAYAQITGESVLEVTATLEEAAVDLDYDGSYLYIRAHDNGSYVRITDNDLRGCVGRLEHTLEIGLNDADDYGTDRIDGISPERAREIGRTLIAAADALEERIPEAPVDERPVAHVLRSSDQNRVWVLFTSPNTPMGPMIWGNYRHVVTTIRMIERLGYRPEIAKNVPLHTADEYQRYVRR